MIVTVQRGVAGIEIAMQCVQQIGRPDPLLSYPVMGQVCAKIAQLAITAYLKRLPSLDNDKDTFSGWQLLGMPKVNNSNDFKMQTQLKQKLKSKTSKSVEVAAS
ncbi:hypothetical protein ACLKA6_003418 [Drosophila palustris]